MNEAEWLAGTDPRAMLDFVRGKVSERKLRLLSAACFARLSRLLPDRRQRRGIAALEEWADGIVVQSTPRRKVAEVREALPWHLRIETETTADDPYFVALMLYRELNCRSIAVHALHAGSGTANAGAEKREQVQLMRCIVGNPHLAASIDDRWLTSTALALALNIYEHRAFDRLPILADALQDAGCDDAETLGHCRDGGPHARGCWVVDSILGKQ